MNAECAPFFLLKCFLGEGELEVPSINMCVCRTRILKKYLFFLFFSYYFCIRPLWDLSFSTVDCCFCIILITSRTGGSCFCRSNQQEPQTHQRGRTFLITHLTVSFVLFECTTHLRGLDREVWVAQWGRSRLPGNVCACEEGGHAQPDADFC